MTVLETSLDTSSQSFAANRAAMLELIDEFRGLEQKVRDNSARRIDRFHERGQLMPRERIALLLDRGAPWVELSTLAGYKMHDDDGARNIAGGNSLIGVGLGPLPTALLALPFGILATVGMLLATDRLVYRFYRKQKSAPIVFVMASVGVMFRSEEHTSELQSRRNLVCRLLLEKKNI